MTGYLPFLLVTAVLLATPRLATMSRASAQDDPSQRMRAAMEASAATQRESVRRQAQVTQASQGAAVSQSASAPLVVVPASQDVPAAVPGERGWYTVPWPRNADWIQPFPPIGPTVEPTLVPASAAAWDLMPPSPRASANLPCQPISPVALSPMIEDAAGREGFSPDLLRAVIRQESAFYPCAISNKGAMGLMQLMPATAATFGVSDPLEPSGNVAAGAKFLGQLLNRYGGDLSLALAAYNAGPGKVDAHGGVPPYPETKNYVRSILDTLGASQ